MKLPKVSAVLAAAALAPTVLFPSMASAAEQPAPTGVSGPDTASDAVGDHDSQEALDRAEVQRILADKESGPDVRAAAKKALAGTAADLRYFLTVGLEEERQSENRLKAAQLLSGGPAVHNAARAALNGTYEDVLRFLKEGQYRARAEDEANAAAAAKPTTSVEAAQNSGAEQGQPTGQTVQPAGAVSTNANPAPAVAPARVATTTTGAAAPTSGQLAATGADEGLGWEAGGAAAAVAAGAALVAVSRRRHAAES
ncbi:ALF repeat-containing protein [Kitasatospora sp. NPDC058218]|uniref:ALF repeat-containing protein n=1 Tax=Kitasatospora sp. NPDC058218 TaxID=3346385 RepID=UPI0036D963EF